MSCARWKPKDPQERLDYYFSVKNELAALGDNDTVQSATATLTGPATVPALVVGTAIPYGGVAGKVFIEGGADGSIYTIDFTLTTTLGRVYNEEFQLLVRE